MINCSLCFLLTLLGTISWRVRGGQIPSESWLSLSFLPCSPKGDSSAPGQQGGQALRAGSRGSMCPPLTGCLTDLPFHLASSQPHTHPQSPLHLGNVISFTSLGMRNLSFLSEIAESQRKNSFGNLCNLKCLFFLFIRRKYGSFLFTIRRDKN